LRAWIRPALPRNNQPLEASLPGAARCATPNGETAWSCRSDRLTVLFDDVGYKTLSLRAIQNHNLLVPDDITEPARDP
jgi:hypothetical protein